MSNASCTDQESKPMSDKYAARAQRLGELIKDARLHAERSGEECARVLGISPGSFENVEQGEFLLSLSDLEALAIYLGVPMGYFWGTESLAERISRVDYAKLIELRNRVIGVLLRQLRLKARRTQKELSQATGIDSKDIRQYETGLTAIPYLHLEQLCQELGVSIEHFVEDQRGPLGRHEADQKLRRLFRQMTPEIQAFLLNPVNVSYLETAWRLSEMDVAKLREIGESLLDITL
jgi:transcriptional regulator with XRE-family HTH domain